MLWGSSSDNGDADSTASEVKRLIKLHCGTHPQVLLFPLFFFVSLTCNVGGGGSTAGLTYNCVSTVLIFALLVDC